MAAVQPEPWLRALIATTTTTTTNNNNTNNNTNSSSSAAIYFPQNHNHQTSLLTVFVKTVKLSLYMPERRIVEGDV
jgi:hypothetical protein